MSNVELDKLFKEYSKELLKNPKKIYTENLAFITLIRAERI